MKASYQLCIAIILMSIILPGFQCERDYPGSNCGTLKTDSVFLPFNVVNQQPVHHILDTVRLYSRISDTVNSQAGTSFVYPLTSLYGKIQAYKVVLSGSSYGLNYANIEFNYLLNQGIFQTNTTPGYAVLFERNEPYNNLSLSIIPGDSGLYLFTVLLGQYNYENSVYFFRGNDRCTEYMGYTAIPPVIQNKQYWDSLGITSLALINSSNSPINSADKNYFFLKINP